MPAVISASTFFSGIAPSTMQIDSLTVVVFGLFIKLVLGGLFIGFGIADRRAAWYGWWAAALLIGCVASVVYVLSDAAPDLVTIGFGSAALIMAYACCWQAARVFDLRAPLWLPLLGAPAVWLAACAVPEFYNNAPLRVVLSSLLIAPLLLMTAVEFWRGRREQLPSRWSVIVLFALLGLFFLARVPLISVLPFPFGALPPQPGWVGAFNLVMFAHTILLSVLLVAISKERFELDQRTKAQTDPLTGALNRRAFASRGSRLLARHAYEQAPLCLLFLDLDHFKSLNDRFGHSGGDDVLMRFVNQLNSSIRPTDFLFRIGGEEFCCLLPHTSQDQAQSVAERIRRQFEAAEVDVAGMPVRATVSIGIASTETFGYDLHVLTRRADSAVYAAKRAGRNRVMIAEAADAVDQRTLQAYEADAAGYAKTWHAQPQPTDLHEIIRRFFRPGSTADIGCGSGREVAFLTGNGFAAVGYDASEALLAEARRRYPHLSFGLAALPALPGVPEAAFDNVLCETVLMHLPRGQIAPAVRRLLTLLKPGGTLYLSWRVTEDGDQRDPKGRLYTAFDADLVRAALDDAAILLDDEPVSASSGKVIHRMVARKAG
jgi:diguanylate cyclase (GGDEF)-like protein